MPRLVENATARERGMLTSTGAPMVDSTSWTREAGLGVRHVQDHVPGLREHVQLAEDVQAGAQAADAGDVHGADPDHVGALFHGGQPDLGQAGGGVHHDVLELFRAAVPAAG